MTTLPRLLAAAVAVAGFAATASAQHSHHQQPQYPQPQPPVYRSPLPPPPSNSFNLNVQVRRSTQVVEQPVYAPPRQPVYEPPVYQQPVYAPPQQPVYEQPVFVPPHRQVKVYHCLDDFARDFHPCPGKHHVIVNHPVTKRPVEVCFTLPDCKLRDVDVNRRSVEFDYGKHSVNIEFNRDGTVCVHDD